MAERRSREEKQEREDDECHQSVQDTMQHGGKILLWPDATVHPLGPLQRRGVGRNKNAAAVGVQRLVRRLSIPLLPEETWVVFSYSSKSFANLEHETKIIGQIRFLEGAR